MKLIEAEAQAMDQFGSATTVARLAKPTQVRRGLARQIRKLLEEVEKESGGADFMWGLPVCEMGPDSLRMMMSEFSTLNRSLVNILLVVALVPAAFCLVQLHQSYGVIRLANRAKEILPNCWADR